MEKLKAGGKFDEVAKEFSEDKARAGKCGRIIDDVLLYSRTLGGALGWKTRGDLDPKFEEVAFELEASTTTSPKYAEVKTDHGYHIIMVDGRK